MATKKIYIPGKGYRCQRNGRFVKCPSNMKGTSGTRKTRKRRSKRSSWFGGFGQTGMIEQFKPQLINGGLAAIGAWASQTVGRKVGQAVKVDPYSTTGNILTLVVGVVLAGIIGKVLKKPQFGVALGTGAVAITLLNFIGTLTPKTAGLGVLQAENAPYYQRASLPPIASVQPLPPGAASVPNLQSDFGVASIV